MLSSRELFVGRRRELARGEVAITDALDGRGRVLLFSGEAGVGKTRVAQAIVNEAAGRGARVAWGRAWEAGGAPAYWPWIQIFRALGARDDPFDAEEMAGGGDPTQARFAQFDRAARWLKKESNEAVLAIVLDDLHAADVPTLLFLQFLARDLSGARLLVLGTYRELEARLSPDVDAILGKVAREGEAIPLDRLSTGDVLDWICATSGESPEAARADAERVHGLTEGNALFIHELLRVRGRSKMADPISASGLRIILDEHLARLGADTREILAMASVLGREIDPDVVVAALGRSRDDVTRALREACEVDVLLPIAGGERMAFAHILLRERLYAELLPSRQAELHGLVAEALLARRSDPATAIHHLLKSSSARDRVVAIAEVAGRAALGRLAFENAAHICERTLAKHAADDEPTTSLEVMLGEALMRSGKVDEGRDTCARAAERAKRINSAEKQAEAALAYGIEITTGSLDPRMVTILEDALAALPEEDNHVRARVVARHAAALVPPRSEADAMRALEGGTRAVEMARRLADPDTLLYTLHFGSSAMGYLVPAERRNALCGELFALAKSRNRPLTLLTVSGWWIAALREQGRAAEAEATLTFYEHLVREFPQPYYQWRIPMIQATGAVLRGDFAEAERLSDEARAIVDDGGFVAARVAWVLHRLSLAMMRGDPASLARDAERIEAGAAPVSGARGFLVWLYAATGRTDEARSLLELVAKEPRSFPWCIVASEAACLLADTATAERLYEAICTHAEDNPIFWGPFGIAAFGPTHRVAGDVARFLGRYDEARRWYEQAVAIGERMAAPAIVKLAERRLEELDALQNHAPRSSDPPTSSPSPKKVEATFSGKEGTVRDLELRREGEMWRISSSTGVTVHLKDSKGLLYLSQLLARPGVELHVTQLADASEVSTDAGAVLDERAKSAYKRRVEDLREQLEEAERFADSTRAAALRAELDAVACQLAGAVGLGGRDRKLGSHVERVRINVQRRLKDAIQRIREHDPALGRYLDATVKTGNFCVFAPL